MLQAILFLAILAPDDKEAEDALERFKSEYKNPAPQARASAVSSLARVQHEKTLLKVEGVFLSGEDILVRIAAAKALGSFTDWKRKVTQVLLTVLPSIGKDGVALAEAVYESIGKLGDETALAAIHPHFEDKDEKIAKAALGAAGDIKSSKSIEPIIEVMKKYEKITGADKKNNKGTGGVYLGIPGGGDDPQKKLARDVLPACIKALTAITKEKWTTSKEWIIWWDRHRGDAAPR